MPRSILIWHLKGSLVIIVKVSGPHRISKPHRYVYLRIFILNFQNSIGGEATGSFIIMSFVRRAFLLSSRSQRKRKSWGKWVNINRPCWPSLVWGAMITATEFVEGDNADCTKYQRKGNYENQKYRSDDLFVQENYREFWGVSVAIVSHFVYDYTTKEMVNTAFMTL